MSGGRTRRDAVRRPSSPAWTHASGGAAREPETPESGDGPGVEDLAWAGITVAAEAATLGVRLLSRALEAVRGPRRQPVTPPVRAAGARLTTLGLRRRTASAPRRPHRYLRAFWHRAYEENITGLAAMVAYNLFLALFPFALLVLFIFGQILQSQDVETQRAERPPAPLPGGGAQHARRRPDRIRDSSTTIGARGRDRRALDRDLVLGRDGHRLLPDLPRRLPRVARAEAVRARDAARRHPVPRGAAWSSRPWRASSSRAPSDLPFGLAQINGIANVAPPDRGALATFLLCCVIYYFVPKGHVPWHGVWPGALFVTVTTAIANAVYPFYLAQVSSVGEVGGTIGFVLIALVWFYLVSLAMMAGRGDQRPALRAARHGLRSPCPQASSGPGAHSAVAAAGHLAQLQPVVAGLDGADGARARAHHQRLGRRLAARRGIGPPGAAPRR